jgi:lysyl-tRNA synthetase class 1
VAKQDQAVHARFLPASAARFNGGAFPSRRRAVSLPLPFFVRNANVMSEISQLAAAARAWPFEQARVVIERLKRRPKEVVTFQSGYGPSGLPHIGTFCENARPSMVRHAFETITEGKIKTRLLCVSDDMDAMRKVPPNVPNQALLHEHLGKPLSRVPDPFGEHESFAAHNNARLRRFLDSFGFEYQFMSATANYTSGVYDEMLLRMLERFDAVMAIMLPTLGDERAETYSPFLPISPTTGRVLQVATLERNVAKGTIVFEDENGKKAELPVTGGHVKVQWKPDWALRWAALGVDYEMSGKDLIDSVRASTQIVKALGAVPPETYNYELFLDENGQRISKTKGNGIAIEEWLKYAPPESLSLFQYQKPKTAKRLYFDVIPKAVDDYASFLEAYAKQNPAERLENPVWHIHAGHPPAPESMAQFAPATNAAATSSISFSLLLNLVSAANAETKEHLWKFIEKYAPGASPETHPRLDELCGYAIAYYDDFVKPAKSFRPPTAKERAALEDLTRRLGALDPGADGKTIQDEVYAVGNAHAFESLRDWFTALYEVLLGQEQGPRFGSFVAIFGIAETRALIARALEGALAPHA